MRRSEGRSFLSTIAWGSIAGAITLAAGLAGLGGNSPVGGFRLGWITLGAAGSVLYTSYWLRAAAKETTEIDAMGSKVDVASEVLGRLDSRENDSTLVLLASILAICTEQAVMAASAPELFNVLVQTCLECLHTAITRSHATDGANVRVAVLSCQQGAKVSSRTAGQDLIYYPRDRKLEIDLAGEAADHANILMSRQHPYEHGWLRCPDDGLPAGPQGHILPPEDSSVVSYIRVGIPHVGVLLVCSWETPLSVAGRRLTAAFADILALPYNAQAASGKAVPVQATGGRELEGAQ
jgi:hypothetical protein